MLRSLVLFSPFALLVVATACSSDPVGQPGDAGGAGGISPSGAGGSGGAATTSKAGATTSATTSTGGAGGSEAGGGGAGGDPNASSSVSSVSSVSSSTASSASSASSGGGGGGTPEDPDGDGWKASDGDCCESESQCSEPASVNPGALEFPGNFVDDDCDPATKDDAPVASCSEAALQTPTSAKALLQAMDLCQFTTENPPLAQRKWGVISVELTLADGTKKPNDLQVGVLAKYGAVSPVTPAPSNKTFAALSTGTARAVGDPGHRHPQNGPKAGQDGNYNALTAAPVPADYLAANGGTVPSPAGCGSCTGADCKVANDSVRLKARIRVPTNAQSLEYRFRFFSAEYPEFLCQEYNDFFVTRLMTGAPLPPDRNIAKDALGNAISVNNAFFDVCFPYLGAPAGSCPLGTSDLVGTGMGGWDGDLKDGGGTAWLFNEWPVVPGETIDIEWITWDAKDHNVDSIVLLDRFKFRVAPSSGGVHE